MAAGTSKLCSSNCKTFWFYFAMKRSETGTRTSFKLNFADFLPAMSYLCAIWYELSGWYTLFCSVDCHNNKFIVSFDINNTMRCWIARRFYHSTLRCARGQQVDSHSPFHQFPQFSFRYDSQFKHFSLSDTFLVNKIDIQTVLEMSTGACSNNKRHNQRYQHHKAVYPMVTRKMEQRKWNTF